MSLLDQAEVIEFSKVCDPRGNLSFIEGGCHVPFPIKRVFYIYDVPGGATRGSHAHIKCHEVIIAVSGSFDVHLSDGVNHRVITLNNSNKGLHVPPGLWLSTHNFTTGSVCLTLCSEIYEEEDYIRDFDEFIEYSKQTEKKDA